MAAVCGSLPCLLCCLILHSGSACGRLQNRARPEGLHAHVVRLGEDELAGSLRRPLHLTRLYHQAIVDKLVWTNLSCQAAAGLPCRTAFQRCRPHQSPVSALQNGCSCHGSAPWHWHTASRACPWPRWCLHRSKPAPACRHHCRLLEGACTVLANGSGCTAMRKRHRNAEEHQRAVVAKACIYVGQLRTSDSMSTISNSSRSPRVDSMACCTTASTTACGDPVATASLVASPSRRCLKIGTCDGDSKVRFPSSSWASYGGPSFTPTPAYTAGPPPTKHASLGASRCWGLLSSAAHQGHDAIDLSRCQALPGVVRQAKVTRRAILHSVQRVPHPIRPVIRTGWVECCCAVGHDRANLPPSSRHVIVPGVMWFAQSC